MSLLRRIPSNPLDAQPFLREVDFPAYAVRLAGLSLTEPQALNAQGTDQITPHRLVNIQDRLNELRMILASSSTGNPWLQGDKGTGKSSLIEALLRARAEKQLSSQTLSKPFFIFDANRFFITTPRQNWVAAFDACLQNAQDRKGIVIFDNADDFIHTADGEAGRLVNTLISHLEQGEDLQAIMASRTESATMINEASTGIAREFELLSLNQEPGFDMLRPMLAGHIARLEETYNAHYTQSAIDEIVRLLSRYPGRGFMQKRPGNAIAFADKVGAYVRLSKYAEPPMLASLREDIGNHLDELVMLDGDSSAKAAERMPILRAELEKMRADYQTADTEYKTHFAPIFKAQAMFDDVTRRVTPLRDKPERTKDENETFDRLQKAEITARRELDAIEKSLYPKPPEVTATHVRHVFNIESGIAIKSEEERVRRLDQVPAYLDTQIYLQDEPKDALAKAYINRELGVSDPTRPAGVFIFAGGTGLGKTELMRALARFDLGVENRPDLADNAEPVVVNMNQYQSASSVSNLTGSARGFIGYDEAVPWLEAVRANPRSLVMLDECNKAHPSMFNTIMQIADTGKLTDSHGKDTNFCETLMALALNGLTADDFALEDLHSDEAVRAKLLRVVSTSDEAKDTHGDPLKLFTPEFIARVDGVFVFDKLGEPQLLRIFRNQQLKRLDQDYSQQGISVAADDETTTGILRKFNAAQNGGRGPRQIVNKRVRPLITTHLLARKKAAIEAGQFEDLPPEQLRLTFDGTQIGLASMGEPVPVRTGLIAPILRTANNL